jgi:hypothetical protein
LFFGAFQEILNIKDFNLRVESFLLIGSYSFIMEKEGKEIFFRYRRRKDYREPSR